jgi:hypothetical protein
MLTHLPGGYHHLRDLQAYFYSKSYKTQFPFLNHAPDRYDRTIFKTKCDRVFDLIYTLASAGEKWAAQNKTLCI